MTPHDSDPKETPTLRFRSLPPPDTRQAYMFYALFLAGLLIALGGVVGGFMYGDAYGRKHAQYDNPQLREYYSGQCYAYWENHPRL